MVLLGSVIVAVATDPLVEAAIDKNVCRLGGSSVLASIAMRSTTMLARLKLKSWYRQSA
jgi:hypothetical protein